VSTGYPTNGEHMTRKTLLMIPILIAVAGCASESGGNRRDTMTQRQRDSVLSTTGLPGAQGVAKALNAADSAKARQARLDSASRP
jgi:hypothetical protein